MAKINKTLPEAIAVFPKLNEVDVYQPKNPKTGKPSGDPKRTFNTRLKFNEEDHRAVDAWLKKTVKDAGFDPKTIANWPWKKDKKTNEITLLVSTGEEYPPGLFDSKNKPLPAGVKIGGGSTIKTNVSPFVYEGLGGGIKLYLNAVMVKKLERGVGNGVSPFEADDDDDSGYVAPDAPAEPQSPFDPNSVAGDDEDSF